MLANLAGYLQIEPWPPLPGPLFWLALALVAGALLGEAVQRAFAWPRIVGYGAVGLLLAAAGFGPEAGRLPAPLKLVVDLALGVLLFELGSRVRLAWLRDNPWLLATGVLESLASFVAVAVLLRSLGFGWPLALTGAAIVVPVSAAVVGRVAGELGAAGQVTERLIVLTAFNTMVGVLAHKLISGWLHVDLAGDWVRAIAQPLWAFAGSVLLAALLARAVGTVARRMDLRNENTVLLVLGLIVVAQLAASLLNLSTLLPLLAGVLLRNGSERPWVWPRHFGTAGGVLVLMLFVIVGSAWSPALLAQGLGLALALLGVRWAVKALAVQALARQSGITQRQGLALSLGLAPISGTALVLFADTAAAHLQAAAALAPMLLTAIALMELIGPLAVQWGLTLGREQAPGEGAMTLEAFTTSDALTLGVELELQIVNRHDYDLAPGAADLLRLLEKQRFPGNVVPEITDSMIELSTGICRDHADALAQLGEIRDALVHSADRLGLALSGGGTHPFQDWSQRRIFDKPRFRQISELYGYLSKQFTIFGQHVHVGCPDADGALRLLHGLSRHIPHLIALSASSPFVQGTDTGFHSARLNSVFAFPLSGRAPFVQTWAEMGVFFEKMTRTGVVKSMKDFYWDIRPKPEYGTVEVRVLDTPLTIEKAAALAGLIQCLARWITQERPFEPQEDDYLPYTFNRFQACRFGLDGVFVDPATGEQRVLRDEIDALLTRLEGHAAALRAENAIRLLRGELNGDGNDAAWIRRTMAAERLLPEVVRQQAQRWSGR